MKTRKAQLLDFVHVDPDIPDVIVCRNKNKYILSTHI